MFAINHCTITPVRLEPSESSEQLTQLLFGELCEVLDTLPRWTKIRSTVDGQEGWVDFKMVTTLPSHLSPITSNLSPLTSHLSPITSPIAIATSMEDGQELMLTLGTRLPNYSHGTFEVLDKQYIIDPAYVTSPIAHSPSPIANSQSPIAHLISAAKSLLNAPYLWGGKNVMGIDCSGFTQVVYATVGVNLLRNAREQITQGAKVRSLQQALPGDLVFFDHADRDPNATNISHVGMLLSPTEVIHCSGNVHIDYIDEQGIHLPDGTLTHHLVQINRYI